MNKAVLIEQLSYLEEVYKNFEPISIRDLMEQMYFVYFNRDFDGDLFTWKKNEDERVDLNFSPGNDGDFFQLYFQTVYISESSEKPFVVSARGDDEDEGALFFVGNCGFYHAIDISDDNLYILKDVFRLFVNIKSLNLLSSLNFNQHYDSQGRRRAKSVFRQIASTAIGYDSDELREKLQRNKNRLLETARRLEKCAVLIYKEHDKNRYQEFSDHLVDFYINEYEWL